MSELDEHLVRVQEIATRTRAFQVNEGSDPKEFSKTVVEDIGALADGVAELIRHAKG